jgi:hypothetical protein
MRTAYTYQGRLIEGDDAGDGLYDFAFKLFDDPCTGTQQGSTVNIDDLDVIDGYFTVELDFGVAFKGDARWLEIDVRPGASIDGNDFVTLIPRQEVTPTPYALYAQSAEDANTVDGLHANEFASRTHSHNASSITSGTLSTSRYSAFSDLSTEGYLGNLAGDIAQNNGILQPKLNADALDGLDSSDFLTSGNDFGRSGVSSNLYEGTTALSSKYLGISAMASNSHMLDGFHESSFFQLSHNETVSGRPYFYGGTTGATPPFYVDSTNVVINLNADRLDGLHSTSFAASGHTHNYDATYVNVTGDSMTGALEAYYETAKDYAVKGEGQFPPTNGYLGVQGNNSYDGITSTYWSGREIGVAGISTGTTTTDNYGVLGHASRAGVRGEYSGDPNTYGELGRDGYAGYFVSSEQGGYGVYSKVDYSGSGLKYAGYFECDSETGYGVYATVNGDYTNWAFRGEGTGTGSSGGWFSTTAEDMTAVYGTATSTSGTSNTNKGGYFTAHGDRGYGVYARAYGEYGTGIYASGGTSGYAAQFYGNVKIIGRSSGTTVMELGEGLDYAEGFDVTAASKIEPGSVLVIDADNPGKLALSNTSYDTKVAGIVAGAKGLGSGVRLGAGQFDYDVALAGRVYCKVDATKEAVTSGDLLTTSAMPGYAMKAADYTRSHGAILGKAMESMEKGQKGQILVLVTLQ